MKLRKKKRLLNLFNKANVRLVLHGHSHEMLKYQRDGIKFFNAGASIDNKAKLVSYFILEIDETQIFSETKNVKLEDTYLDNEPTVQEIVMSKI